MFFQKSADEGIELFDRYVCLLQRQQGRGIEIVVGGESLEVSHRF